MTTADYRRSIYLSDRANSRIPEDVFRMNINDFIASLTDITRSILASSNSSSPTSIKVDNQQVQSLERAIGMYAHLRDKYGATTVGEATDRLKTGKVDPRVVQLWVEEGMCVNPLEYMAVIEGYPEHKSTLEEQKRKSEKEVLDWLRKQAK